MCTVTVHRGSMEAALCFAPFFLVFISLLPSEAPELGKCPYEISYSRLKTNIFFFSILRYFLLSFIVVIHWFVFFIVLVVEGKWCQNLFIIVLYFVLYHVKFEIAANFLKELQVFYQFRKAMHHPQFIYTWMLLSFPKAILYHDYGKIYFVFNTESLYLLRALYGLLKVYICLNRYTLKEPTLWSHGLRDQLSMTCEPDPILLRALLVAVICRWYLPRFISALFSTGTTLPCFLVHHHI
jgi:hypothetical protein